MKTFLLKIVGVVAAFLSTIFAAKGWGKEKAKRKILEQQQRASRDAKKIDDDLARRSGESKRDELHDDWSRPD